MESKIFVKCLKMMFAFWSSFRPGSMRNIFILSFVFLIFTNFNYAVKNSVNKISVVFGKGGGITGLYDRYKLHSNGVLSKYTNADKTLKYMKTVPRTKFNLILKKLQAKDFLTINQNEAGNMSAFIELYKGVNLFKRYQWPIEKSGLPRQLKEIDSLLNSLL